MQSYNMSYTFLIVCALISYTSGLVVHENVVFHKTNEVSSNHARWLVTFIHDLLPYQVFIDKINKYLDMTHEIMKTLTDWYRQYNFTGYVFTFESLHDEIGILMILIRQLKIILLIINLWNRIKEDQNVHCYLSLVRQWVRYLGQFLM